MIYTSCFFNSPLSKFSANRDTYKLQWYDFDTFLFRELKKVQIVSERKTFSKYLCSHILYIYTICTYIFNYTYIST